MTHFIRDFNERLVELSRHFQCLRSIFCLQSRDCQVPGNGYGEKSEEMCMSFHGCPFSIITELIWTVTFNYRLQSLAYLRTKDEHDAEIQAGTILLAHQTPEDMD